MIPIMNQCSDIFISILNDAPNKELDIYEPYQALTLDVICRCALALQLDCQTNPHVSCIFTHLFKILLKRPF